MGGLLTGLCRLWGIGGTGTIDQKRSRLKESAKGRFLIVDEADNLTKGRPVRQILRMIEIFRKMYDNGAGIALVGLPSFLDDIRSAGETYIYIYSRIQFKSDITPPNRDQMTAVWKNRINGVPVNSAETEKIILSAPKSGYFRYVQSVADTAKKFGDVEAALAVSFIA
ncbi:MAG: hypothetical protein GY749_08995 [Desulfobacteraceae bacterium]|nr:hypothetical protein [Desulfobacteraceae bacterium]